MNIKTVQPPDDHPRVWTPTELIEDDPNQRRRKGRLEWWYRRTAPAELPASADLAQRELVRRGRLASTLMFSAMIVLIPVWFVGLLGNHIIMFAVSALLLLITIAAIFNRRGRANIAGLMLSFSFNLAIIMVIVTSPGGIAPSMLGLFDLLVFVEIFVASLLPVNWVFLAAAFNIAFIAFDLMTQTRTASFAAMMATDAFPVILRPIILHIVVTVVLWLWVKSATDAIERADRAEVIANLEHTVAEQERMVAQQTRQLDNSIQEIVNVHMRVANGDFNARVPLTQDNALWQIAGSLNNLLSRFQRLRQDSFNYQRMQVEVQKMQRALSVLLAKIHEAKSDQQPLQVVSSGTLVDPLLKELNGAIIITSNESTPFSSSQVSPAQPHSEPLPYNRQPPYSGPLPYNQPSPHSGQLPYNQQQQQQERPFGFD